ncbi:hypothetical protein VP01_238g13 [Puccinia sorghi]|uniref:Uncharacterized protein n=1 Tax=Puccinia sorghi TaxID=27349 RepID=A0A0L6V6T4_9BASI|nr:hypothetical protein VP01_238g13 [Puccinia sorghi]
MEKYTDTDIAKLLLLESQTYQQSGSRGSNGIWEGKALKTNKRFLKSVIRNVNDHNRQLERKPERSSSTPAPMPPEEEEARHRHHHRKTGSRSSSKLQAPDSHHSTHFPRGTEQRTSREDQDYNNSTTSRRIERSRSRHHHSSSSQEKRKRSRDMAVLDSKKMECDSGGQNKKSLRQEKEADRSSPRMDLDSYSRRKSKTSKSDAPQIKTSSEGRTYHDGTEAAIPSTSKMDKYFSASYDPRLDVNLEDVTNPETGLIEGGNYDDWELILQQMRAKREAKAREKEKKLEEKLAAAQRKLRRHEEREERRELRRKSRKHRKMEEDRAGPGSPVARDALLQDQDQDGDGHRHKRRDRKEERAAREATEPSRKTKKHGRKPSSSSSSSDELSSSSSSSRSSPHRHTRPKTLGLMDVKGYSKRGQPREWDLGKPSPT